MSEKLGYQQVHGPDFSTCAITPIQLLTEILWRLANLALHQSRQAIYITFVSGRVRTDEIVPMVGHFFSCCFNHGLNKVGSALRIENACGVISRHSCEQSTVQRP